MEVIYKRNLNQSYMRITSAAEREDLHELEMLAHNRIPGLLPVEMEAADTIKYYWYNITQKQSLADYLERKMAGEELLRLLVLGLSNMLWILDNYLLEEQRILISAEYIYLDFEESRIFLTYLPGKLGKPTEECLSLMELLLQKLDHGDQKAVALGYDLYQGILENKKSFSEIVGKSLKEMPTKVAEAKEKEIKTTDIPLPKESPVKIKLPGILERIKKRIPCEKKAELERAFVPQEEESFLTEYLGQEGGIAGKLLYQGEGKLTDICLDKPVFIIGKSSTETDGCVNDRSVSRIHAKIEAEQEEYYLEDLNSTNGTFLNGVQMEYRQKAKLAPKDRIAFGTAEYIFM